MTWALYTTAAVVAIAWTLCLRLSVRLVAKTADNGWDNALGYGLATVLLWLPLKWMFDGHHWALMTIFPGLLWAGQTVALRWIYEIRLLRAWLLGVVHALIAGVVVGSMAVTAGAIAAYVLYGRIVSDPLWLIGLILRLIGIELPFDLPAGPP